MYISASLIMDFYFELRIVSLFSPTDISTLRNQPTAELVVLCLLNLDLDLSN